MRKISVISFAILLMFIFAGQSLAQRTPPVGQLPKCKAQADQIYFVASGQMVSDVHPGGNGYQLNIIGAGANKFTLVKDDFMTSVSLIAGYTNDSQAKWQVYFNPNMGREITSVRMMSECTGRAVNAHGLTVNVVLRDQ